MGPAGPPGLVLQRARPWGPAVLSVWPQLVVEPAGGAAPPDSAAPRGTRNLLQLLSLWWFP